MAFTARNLLRNFMEHGGAPAVEDTHAGSGSAASGGSPHDKLELARYVAAHRGHHLHQQGDENCGGGENYGGGGNYDGDCDDFFWIALYIVLRKY